MNEFEKVILSYFVDEMEREGHTYKTIQVSFTPETITTINKKYDIEISNEDREKLLNKLIANEYINYTGLCGQFNRMSITPKGVGIVKSLRSKAEQLQNRTIIKKFSDAVTEHQGVVTIIGVSLVILGLLLRYKGII